MSKNDLEIETIARGVALWGDAILLCRSVKGGHSYLPGGHVELGEAAATALRREFQEECGLSPTIGRLLLTHEHVFRQKGRLRHEINLVFHVEQTGLGTGIAPPLVPSLEPKIAFEWVPRRSMHQVDLRPDALGTWLTTLDITAPPAWRSDLDAD